MSLLQGNEMKTWEERISGQNFKLNPIQKSRRIIVELLDGFSMPNLGQDVFLNRTLYVLSKLPNSGRSKLRHVLTRLYPSPILQNSPIDLEIFVFTAEKDLELLELSAIAAIKSCQNRVVSLTVVAPSSIEPEIVKLFTNMSISTRLNYLSDEELLKRFKLENFDFIRPNIKMEILKVVAVLNCDSDAVLLVDGDTILLEERNWITEEKQIVLVAQEYTPSHVQFNRKFLNLKHQTGLGFVTHHQVVRRTFIEELVLEGGGLLNFVNCFDSVASDFYLRSGSCFPSEWQLFGDFLLSRYPESAVLSSFRNLGMSRKNVTYFSKTRNLSVLAEILRLQKAAPNLASVSFHGYKDKQEF
jgi:hypothetical protein